MTEQLKHPEARRRVTAARTALVLDEPFFGTLALRLKLVEEPDCDCPDLKQCPHTAWVDGQSLGYFPRFVMSLTHPQLSALLVHEVMHCAAGHPWRRDNRDPRKWNEAADRAINPVLREAGYTLPPDGLFELEPSHKGKSAEWIFDRLPRPNQEEDKRQGAGGGAGNGSLSAEAALQQSPASGQGQAKGPPGQGRKTAGQGPAGTAGNGPGGPQDAPNCPPRPNAPTQAGSGPENGRPGPQGPAGGDHKSSLGEVRDSPTASDDPAETVASEAEWQQAVQQAAVLAKGQGNMPGALKRFAKVAAESRIDWRSALRRFVQEIARSDYSFARPNSRYVAGGMYLPSLRNQEVGVLAIAVDTSGSIDQVLLEQFAGEIRTIADEVRPRQIRVMYADTEVQREDTFERDDPIVLRATGGGGTDFRPVFTHIEGWDEPPVAVVYLTDLCGTFPEEEPSTPTLWVTGNERPRPVPFGEVVTAS